MAIPIFDLAIRWPDESDWGVLLRRRTVPVYGFPRWLKFPGGRVWIRHASALVLRFDVEGVSGPRMLTLPDGVHREGYRLVMKPNTLNLLDPSRPLSSIPDPEGARFNWRVGGFRYLQRSPFALVNTGGLGHAEAYTVPLEVTRVDATNVATLEHVRRYPERALVATYDKWLGHPGRLVRYALPIPGEGVLLTDAYDVHRHMLIEAKAEASRPAIRMAIGQLLDYERYLPTTSRRLRRAVLLPQRPPKDMLELLNSQRIEAIWRTARGFSETGHDRHKHR